MNAKNRNVVLSIIIPVYNIDHKLERCIDSILYQTFQDFEILLINDGSTDKSAMICDKLALSDKRIRVLHKRNSGVSHTRNVGLDLAKGTYIGWVDGDDWIEPEMYSLLIQKAKAENADLVWCSYYIDHEDKSYTIRQEVQEDSKSFIEALFDQRMEGMLWNKIMRRDIFIKHQLRFLNGQNMAEDKNMLIKYVSNANIICYVDKPLYHYLQDNPISYTRDLSSSRIYEEIANAEDAINFLKGRNVKLSLNLKYKFQLHAKRRLLYSTKYEDIRMWPYKLRESNWKILGSKHFQFRHKLLAVCAMLKLNFFIKIWVLIKGNS